jgi:hypothetical protein
MSTFRDILLGVFTEAPSHAIPSRGRGAAHGRTLGPTEADARVRDSCVPPSTLARTGLLTRASVVQEPETRAELVVVLSVCLTGLET